MFNNSDSGRRNTVNLGAFGHICTLTLKWYKIRFYGPYQTNRLQYVTVEWKPAFLRQAREFPFFPLLPREARK